MQDIPIAEIDRLRELLLTPTAENVLRVTAGLESLAGKVAKARSAMAAGGPDQEANRRFILDIREKIQQIRNLLDGAARFYSALSATTGSSAYERHGLVLKLDSPRRALARL